MSISPTPVPRESGTLTANGLRLLQSCKSGAVTHLLSFSIDDALPQGTASQDARLIFQRLVLFVRAYIGSPLSICLAYGWFSFHTLPLSRSRSPFVDPRPYNAQVYKRKQGVTPSGGTIRAKTVASTEVFVNPCSAPPAHFPTHTLIRLHERTRIPLPVAEKKRVQ
ncbi:hypothetical protein EDB85DRAFT_1891282 [Lactarius pseudohatsudake]|nr:hypothetical protein EDB85DRAFT_1891282 [Lactarius pseudohatsudake]